MDNFSSVESMIHNVVTVVFRIHFYYIRDPELEMDLKQEGYLKAYELLSMGNYDPSRSLRTFIYTGVRNAMTNYMYHYNKENHVDLETTTNQLWQRYENIVIDKYWEGKIFYDNDSILINHLVDESLVFKICNKYKMFGDYTNIILNELFNLGIYNIKIEKLDDLIPNTLVKNAIITEIIYNMIDK